MTPIRPGLFGQHMLSINGNHTGAFGNGEYPTFGQDPYGGTTSTLRKKRLSAEHSKDLTFSNDSKNLTDNHERVIKLQAVIRGWLVRRQRTLSVFPSEINTKSGITTHRTSHRRISSNANVADYKSMQDLMRHVIEKLVNSNNEDISHLITRHFLNPKVLQMRAKQECMTLDQELRQVMYQSQPIFIETDDVIYHGQWITSPLPVRSGLGLQIWRDGSIYEG